jgi:glutamine amidotransferase
MNKVTIVDYGVGNLLSVRRSLEYVGANVIITSNADEILNANHLILPGVGAFPNAMNALEKLGLVSVLQEYATLNRPLLAICLGMQLLFDESDEFQRTKGLGIIPGKVTKISTNSVSNEQAKIPHIGWSGLLRTSNQAEWPETILGDCSERDSVYFVHSYMAVLKDPANLIASVLYGGNKITAVVGKEKITGCQFHPEKSGEVGLSILKRFVAQ